MLSYTLRPISDRSWFGTMGAEPTRFSSKWSDTLNLLEFELDQIDGHDVVIECDIREQDLRNDGMLRANARPEYRAVVLACESKHGPLLYRCDRFYANWSHQGPEWQHNVRAIAKTLEALRAVDRYGATETGQQYAGFKQLGAGRAMPASHMTSDDAIALLARLCEVPLEHFNTDAGSLAKSWKRARYHAHPDRHDGAREQWDRVEEAGKVLGFVS